MKKDVWENRQLEMKCETCMWYVNMRCRKRAPTLNGYPMVYPQDWCGDHRMTKEQMQKMQSKEL